MDLEGSMAEAQRRGERRCVERKAQRSTNKEAIDCESARLGERWQWLDDKAEVGMISSSGPRILALL